MARVRPRHWISRGPVLFSVAAFGVGCSEDATAPADFSLSLAPAVLTIAQGAGATTTVTITRTNFTGAVTLTLSGAPAGVTGSFNPAAPSGTSSTLTVSVAATVTPGTYNLTVNGTGTPGNRSTALTLTVNIGNVTVDFSRCEVAWRAVWLAYQDGAGAWTRVVGLADVYKFTIGSGRGGLAFVSLVQVPAQSSVHVLYMTQAEFTAGPLTTLCVPIRPIGRTITGTAAGLDMSEKAQITLGGGSRPVNGVGPLAFTLENVSDGTHDLVGYKTDSLTPGADTALLRRDVMVSGNGSVGTVDFRSSEAFAAATATITVGGLSGGETLDHQMSYLVGATCDVAPLVFGAAGATFTASGIPGARQRASDFHVITISASRANDSRLVAESFHTLAARTVTLGASLPTPTVTSLGGPYKRLQAAYMLPADYDSSTGLGYSDGGGKGVLISASTGYVGGASVSLGLADFSSLAGWDNNWAPAASSTGNWNVSGLGGNLLTSSTAPCVENWRVQSAWVGGTF